MQFETHCRQCLFSDEVNGEQVGCKVGRLATYERQGLVVRNEGDTHFRIHDRLCNLCINKDGDWPQSVPEEQWEAKALEQVRPKVRIYIPVYGDETVDDIMKTFASAINQIMPAKHVIILLKPSFPRSQVMKAVQSFNYEEREEAYPGWSVMSVMQSNIAQEPWSYIDTDNLSESKDGHNYGVIALPGQELSLNHIAGLHTLINIDMEQVVYIPNMLEDSLHGVTFNHLVREAMGRDIHQPFIEKLDEYYNMDPAPIDSIANSVG